VAEAPSAPLTVTVSTAGPPGPVRRAAAGAGSAVLLGAVVMTVALIAAPGPWTQGYVSEAGTADMPQASAYRWGLLLLALGVALLGAAVAPLTRPAGLLLAAAGGLAATTAAVPCSAGCPLPPYEVTTAADLAHTGASILGMAVCAVAMLFLAVAPAATLALRWLSAGAAVLTFPMGVTEGIGMLVAGRGPFTAQVERVLLVVVVCWLISAAAVAARSKPLVAPRFGGETVGAGVPVNDLA
jgi:hypothetical protein